ncbi:hypothetical protein XENOCAPTIV_008922 [Xenoophorus captivus]|uniref:Uncharacterized protein n=1 Tax=Xenoophorus captivus TaxID=1517983 RepID=A0ABV0QIC6_9TELE
MRSNYATWRTCTHTSRFGTNTHLHTCCVGLSAPTHTHSQIHDDMKNEHVWRRNTVLWSRAQTHSPTISNSSRAGGESKRQEVWGGQNKQYNHQRIAHEKKKSR